MSEITTKEANELKHDLEKEIAALVQKYSDETELIVDSIYVGHVVSERMDGRRVHFYGPFEVKVELQ